MTWKQMKRAWRRAEKNRMMTFVQLAGLAGGLACTILIYLWVADERQTDRFGRNDERFYQVLENNPGEKGITTSEQTPGLLSTTLSAELPEVEKSVSVVPVSGFDKQAIISVGDTENFANIQFAGRDFFHLFAYPLIEGNPDEVLADRHQLVISKTFALKVFHRTDHLIGQSISCNQQDSATLLTISGVFDNTARISSSSFDAVLSYDLFLDKNQKLKSWRNGDPQTFVLLKAGSSPDKFNAKLNRFLNEKDPGIRSTLFAQNFPEKYLHNHYENGKPSGGRIEYVTLFTVVAFVILFIACVNFMNLATAFANERMKDVGVKKIVGASRRSIAWHFLAESFGMCTVALVLALLLVWFSLPAFNAMTGKQISIHPDFQLIVIIVGVTAVTGLAAGVYPAIYLSGFQPLSAIKGRLKNGGSQQMFRKVLVVIQFLFSSLMMVCVVVIYKQMKLVEGISLGYDRDRLLYFDLGQNVLYSKKDYAPGGRFESDLNQFLNQTRDIPGVESAANFRHNITNRDGGTTDVSWPGKDPDSRVSFTDLAAGFGFIETMKIPLQAGRSYSNSFGTEKNHIVLNEAAVATIGLKDPVGKTIRLWGEDRQIIGVTKDFHFQSLHEKVRPCFFDLTTGARASKIMIRLSPGEESGTLEKLGELFARFNPGAPFSFRFLDEDYQAVYTAEKRLATLSKYFCGLALLISCLGLFGLASFEARQRAREIGIRKVIGASVGKIAQMLIADFARPVVLAMLIAFPVAFLIMSRWLEGFYYRVPINAGVFLMAGSAIGILTLATLSQQLLRASRANPVRALRGE